MEDGSASGKLGPGKAHGPVQSSRDVSVGSAVVNAGSVKSFTNPEELDVNGVLVDETIYREDELERLWPQC